MFVRWIVRGHKNSEIVDVTFHDAYLVESYRDDEGQPRQRTISYLGNIRQIGDTFPGIERELFMLRADMILRSIPRLSDMDRKEVLLLLQKKVPPMTGQEVNQAFRSNLQWYFQWWQENGGAPSQEQVRKMIADAADRSGSVSLE